MDAIKQSTRMDTLCSLLRKKKKAEARTRTYDLTASLSLSLLGRGGEKRARGNGRGVAAAVSSLGICWGARVQSRGGRTRFRSTTVGFQVSSKGSNGVCRIIY